MFAPHYLRSHVAPCSHLSSHSRSRRGTCATPSQQRSMELHRPTSYHNGYKPINQWLKTYHTAYMNNMSIWIYIVSIWYSTVLLFNVILWLNCPANCRKNLVLSCLVHKFNANPHPCDDGDMAFVAWLCRDQSHPASPGGMSNENYTNIAWFWYLLEIYSIFTEIILNSRYNVIYVI